MGPGRFEPVISAPGADIRTDVPKYRIFRDGELEAEVETIKDIWSDDLVTFLLGCSFSFENALREIGIDLPHWGTGENVAMFKTSVDTVPAGPFSGPMVVSMRWIPQDKVVTSVQATSRFPAAPVSP